MKKIVALFLIFSILVIPVSADEQSSLAKVNALAEKVKDLMEKYKNAEIDMVKQEVVTMKDEQGNAKDCDIAIFYANGKQARFTTENGKFDGNFNHKKSMPGDPLSIRLSNCPCTPIETTHTTEWIEIDELKEKLKEALESELNELGKEQGQKFAEKAIKTIFEKLGYGAAASGFLTGFGIGAALGAPIGQYITDTINQILEIATKTNADAAKLMEEAEPIMPGVGWIKPRGAWGNFWGENPQIKNEWDITVRCGAYTIEPANARWTPIPEIERRPQTPTHPKAPEETPEERKESEDEARKEREERERQERERK